jgi:membrane protease subunit HflK
LQDLHPPRAVVAAFRDVSSAFKEKERMGNEAQAYYREKLIKAAGESAWRELGAATHPLDDDDWAAYWTRWKPQLAGEASATINSAQAFADQRTCRAQGDAASFHRKLAVHQSQPRLTELRMFLDALSATMPGKPKVILDRRFGGRRQLFLGLPEGSFGQQLPLVSPATPPE